MHVFVTGASGFVGSAVLPELIAAGHAVLGLARNDAGAGVIAGMGGEVVRGTLQDLATLRDAAAACDGVIHLAFNHDFSRFAESCAQDREAILALGGALEGSTRPMLVTAGLALLARDRPATEADRPSADYFRLSEAAAAELVGRGVRAGVVRLPPSTHGRGDRGFVPMLAALAREKGVSAYVGDGANQWSAAHRSDAARVYRLALERGAQGGPFHAVAEEGVPFRAIAQVIGRKLGLPVASLTPEQAGPHFGWFAPFVGGNLAGVSTRTRSLLGWQPSGPGLLEDLDSEGYLASP